MDNDKIKEITNAAFPGTYEETEPTVKSELKSIVRPDVIIKLIRKNGTWQVRIGDGSIPISFKTCEAVLNAIPEYFDTTA